MWIYPAPLCMLCARCMLCCAAHLLPPPDVPQGLDHKGLGIPVPFGVGLQGLVDHVDGGDQHRGLRVWVEVKGAGADLQRGACATAAESSQMGYGFHF